jgi:hypothetical protein
VFKYVPAPTTTPYFPHQWPPSPTYIQNPGPVYDWPTISNYRLIVDPLNPVI